MTSPVLNWSKGLTAGRSMIMTHYGVRICEQQLPPAHILKYVGVVPVS